MRSILLVLGAAAAPGAALAHTDPPPAPRELFQAWTFAPVLLVGLALSAWLYARGARRLWRRAGDKSRLRRWQVAAFAGGLASLALALMSPLHRLGETLFSIHMVQHQVLLLVAAPLLVLGRPQIAFIWALPLTWRRWVGRKAIELRLVRLWRSVSHPGVAWVIHFVAVWMWHAPALYQAALGDPLLHEVQHACFLGAAVLFWWAVLPAGASGWGGGVFSVFTTAVHASMLGALLTFAPAPLYPVYTDWAAAWGLTLLEDQQIGGMVMWIVGGVVYVIAALGIVARGLRHLRVRPRRSWRSPPAARGGDGT